MEIGLGEQVRRTCRHLLSEINRDPATPTFGCLDRRYWAWKLTDFPEATFQRNLSSLAWYMERAEGAGSEEIIRDAVIAGLRFTARIQHRDGSFDQAYPFERSFGATGFLLSDLIKTYRAVRKDCSQSEKTQIEESLARAAEFLCRGIERHGMISNHLAGAALGLFMAEDFFHEARFGGHARELLDRVLSNQSGEGWFPEYGAADPGYQTLCMHYLAQIYRIAPSESLKSGLENSLRFLQYFIHPDGSFGGEYGSRRTEIYYPGGIAMLTRDFPLAAAMHRLMLASIENLTTVTLLDIDMGNTAPLLSSAILALESSPGAGSSMRLPVQENELAQVFPQAGIGVFGNKRYYAVVGASNGGVLKVFDKHNGRLADDDCGALAEIGTGERISTQATRLENPFSLEENTFTGRSHFYAVNQRQTTPFNYLILRMLNLTVMRLGLLNEAVKKMMVSWLVRTNRRFQLTRTRRIEFLSDTIEVRDTYELMGNLRLKKLSHTGKFNTIHMASSRYYSGRPTVQKPEVIDPESLNTAGYLEIYRTIELQRGKN